MLDIPTNRSRFPVGLEQPAGSFRVCLDTLLLAGYAHAVLPERVSSIAELGCGSGACLCGVGLLRRFSGIGFDCEERLLRAARTNSAALGLDCLHFQLGDVCSPADFSLLNGRFDAVLVNPPYYEVSEGRASQTSLRDTAMRGNGLLSHFCRQACRLLRYHGYFVSIFPARRMPFLLHECETYTLGVRRIQPLASYSKEPANRILLLARKEAQHDCLIEPTLVLHNSDSGRSDLAAQKRGNSKTGTQQGESWQEGCLGDGRVQWTEEAMALCPWLSHSVAEPARKTN